MRNALAIARKELGIYFSTPWAYVVFTGDARHLRPSSSSNLLATFKEVQGLARVYGWDAAAAGVRGSSRT